MKYTPRIIKSQLQHFVAKFTSPKNNQPPTADLALLPPPAIWSRVMIWTLGTGSLGIIAWSTLTTVEETIVLAGEINTERPGVQVTAVDPGAVTAVNVQMHQKVIAGDILITYNDDETDKRLESQLKQKVQIETQQKENQIILSLRRKQAEQRLYLDRNLLQRLEQLLAVGAIQETQILEKKAEIDELEITLESLESEQNRSKAQSNQKIIEIKQSIRELEAKKARFQVASPITGFVQELRHQTIGERIRPSDTISVIVPAQGLKAVVKVPSKLSAPLELNTSADIDIDAFPASDYGTIQAVVSSISPTTSQSSNQSSDKAYEADLKLISPQNPQKLSIDDLRPGMGITAKIRLREKPVISTVFNFLDGLFKPINEQR
jgi:multidrug efflux pump subunit AcrA (membrane-fusion protein)